MEGERDFNKKKGEKRINSMPLMEGKNREKEALSAKEKETRENEKCFFNNC